MIERNLMGNDRKEFIRELNMASGCPTPDVYGRYVLKEKDRNDLEDAINNRKETVFVVITNRTDMEDDIPLIENVETFCNMGAALEKMLAWAAVRPDKFRNTDSLVFIKNDGTKNPVLELSVFAYPSGRVLFLAKHPDTEIENATKDMRMKLRNIHEDDTDCEWEKIADIIGRLPEPLYSETIVRFI